MAMKNPDPTNLSPDHRRSISTTAQIVEKALKEMREVLNDEPAISNNYTKNDIDGILSSIELLEKANKELFQEFHLHHSVSSQSQVLRAKAAYLWTVLMDSKSKKLSRFGKLASEPASMLDDHIDRMLGLLDDLSKHV